MKSILQNEKECYVCAHNLVYVPYSELKSNYILEDHHIFFGTANRKLSEKYGLKAYLCQEHHRGSTGVHNNRVLDLLLKEMAQRRFEEYYRGRYNRSDFIRIFGRNYL